MKPKKLKQKLAALLSCVLSISCILSSMPVIAAPVEKELENFALNCSYETSGAANSSYPDTDGKELTDGVIGSTSYGDAPWAAFLYVADVSFTVDLGSVKDLSSIEGVFLNSQSSGGIPYPEWVKASYSTDGSSWTEGTSETFAEAPLDSVYTYKHSFASPVSARFVRLTCPTAGWVFISEIRALGAKKVAPPDPPTPPAEEKNLAFNCSYETSGAANSSYPDT
ncbi:MAG: discoidin domain-containing protein, partial [Oscillospiraceae bacterium]